jgi:ABC-type Fe3+ transport system permease subunit
VLVLPVAIYLTRHSDSYELLHAGFTIPVALVLGFVALRLARSSRRRSQLTLTPTPDRVATAARILGGLGICIALAALVALAVYGLLEYAGTR